MPRAALHSSTIKIEQKPDIDPDAERVGDIVVADKPFDLDYAEALAFNEEPVTIRLEPSAEKNAATSFPVWVNGKGCEVLMNGRWLEMIYLPVGVPLTVKRKYLEVIVRTKLDTLQTLVSEPESETPNNTIRRFTSAVHSFSIIEDKNPQGVAWLSELRRRNF